MGGAAGGVDPRFGRVLASVRDTIRLHGMLVGGETVVVAVSGGADSVSLLHVLHALSAELHLVLHALYVDHRLRPDSSHDGRFVLDLGARLGVPAEVAAVTVPSGDSPEAAARLARYRALEACADRVGAQRIAVAHTADDQAETVLMRIVQGTGPRGLAAIPPVRGRIIRPLLAERRDALRSLLAGGGLRWVEDPSNADRRFLRNRIRHELLPMLREAYNPEIVRALVGLATMTRATTSAIESLAARELERLACAGPAEIVLPLAELRALPGEIAAEILRQGTARLGGRAVLRAWAHRGLRQALARPGPRPVPLGGVSIEVSGDRLRLSVGPAHTLTCRTVPVPGRLDLPEAGLMLESSLGAPEACALSPDPWRVAFDADLLPGALIVRGRRPGDRMTPFGAVQDRRVKGLLREAGVPRWERDRVPIVQAGPDIAWLGGIRRGAMAPVTSATTRVLQLVLGPLAKGHEQD